MIEIDFAGIDTLHPLNVDIKAGDTLNLNFPDIFFFDETTDYNTNIILDFVDYNANNDRDAHFVSNSILQEPDLTITVTPIIEECGVTGNSASIILENVGCNLPADEQILLIIEDGDGFEVYRRDITFDFEFEQNLSLIHI